MILAGEYYSEIGEREHIIHVMNVKMNYKVSNNGSKGRPASLRAPEPRRLRIALLFSDTLMMANVQYGH